MITQFSSNFEALTGYQPFPWQQRLYDLFLKGVIPDRCNLPTGLGKTSVIPIWLLALLSEARVPRRLVYVVNRRTIVDQSTSVVMELLHKLQKAERNIDSPLHALVCALRNKDCLNMGPVFGVSTLRGEMADNGEWLANPAAPAVVIGTVDMIGSKLLFKGYGDSRRKRPLHAAFLGCDTLFVHDEAHLSPAFGKLLFAVREQQRTCDAVLPFAGLNIMELSATHSAAIGDVLALSEADRALPKVRDRLQANKSACFFEVDNAGKEVREKMLSLALKVEAEDLITPGRVIVYVKSPDDAAKIAENLKKELRKRSEEQWQGEHPELKMTNALKKGMAEAIENRVALLTGRLRGYERDRLVEHPVLQVLSGAAEPAESIFLIATSAGEVGINLNADCMICDLTTLDSMIQRLGRMNRFGDFAEAKVYIVAIRDVTAPKGKRKAVLKAARKKFEEVDGKRRVTLEKSVVSQKKKVDAAEQRVVKQQEKVTVAKTEKDAEKARMKLEAEEQKLDGAQRELSEKETVLIEHVQSRRQRFCEFRQQANLEFVRANAEAWALYKTQSILKRNQTNLSPAALAETLASPCSREAFPALPETYPLTSLLLDLWAQTSVHRNPASPQVESWLHGKREELPETHICWRDELNVFGEISESNAAKWLDLASVRSQETLRIPSGIVKNRNKDSLLSFFVPMQQRLETAKIDLKFPVVILDQEGKLELTTFSTLLTSELSSNLDYATIILPTLAGGLENGTFAGKSAVASDVAADRPCRIQVRRSAEEWFWRLGSTLEWQHLATGGRLSKAVAEISALLKKDAPMRSLFSAQTRFLDEYGEDDSEEWLVLFQTSKMPQSKFGSVSWPTVREHEEAVCDIALKIARALNLPEPIIKALRFASLHHDDGKKSEIWQWAAGHDNPPEPLAKGNVNWRKLKGYRHEMSALLTGIEDADFASLEEQDLALHLICAHHGWARPHARPEAFLEDVSHERREQAILEMAARYERMQARFGWWHLAFFESILRRADAIVSEQENSTMEEEA
jgi:CRISPR-associated endonuclease/helicase Cas3